MIALLLCLGLPLPAQTPAPSAQQQQMDQQCQANLQSLLHAISKYSRDHQGAFPETLDQLVPTYLPRIPACPAGGDEAYKPYSSLQNAPPRAVLICEYPGHRPNGPDYLVVSSDRGLETPFTRPSDPVECRRKLLQLGQELDKLREKDGRYPERLTQPVRCSSGDTIRYWTDAPGLEYQAYCPGAAHLGVGLAPFCPSSSQDGLAERSLYLSPPGTNVVEPTAPTPTWMWVVGGVALTVLSYLMLKNFRRRPIRLD